MGYQYEDQEEEQEMNPLELLNALFNETLGNIEDAFEGGIFDEEDMQIAKAELFQDYQAELAGLMDLDLDFEDEEEYEYEDELVGAYGANNSDVANFSSTSTFGAAVLELAEYEYEDALDVIEDICEVSGHDFDTVVALLEGQFAPDDELATAIAGLFESLADEDVLDAYVAAVEDTQYQALGGEYDDEDEYEDEEDEVVEELAYSVGNLDDRLANFEASQAVNMHLAAQERRASQGIEEGWLTPHSYTRLFGDFASAEEQVASFSQVAAANGQDLNGMLFAIEYALDMAETAGPVASFGMYVEQALSPAESAQARQIEQQARLNYQHYKDA